MKDFKELTEDASSTPELYYMFKHQVEQLRLTKLTVKDIESISVTLQNLIKTL